MYEPFLLLGKMVVFDASVMKTRNFFLAGRQAHLAPEFTAQDIVPLRWTSLTALIEPENSTLNRPNVLFLAPKHTGAEFNLRHGLSMRK